MVAGAIHPLIYGSDGKGGIAGVFKGIFGGGKQDPIKAATDLNTAVTAQNSVAIASLTAVFAAAMGMACSRSRCAWPDSAAESPSPRLRCQPRLDLARPR